MGSRRICWCYQHGFTGNPIALQAIRSLVRMGWAGSLVEGGNQTRPTKWLPENFILRNISLKIPRLWIFELAIKFFYACLISRADVFMASQPLVCLSAWCAAWIKHKPLVYYTYELFGEEDASASHWATRFLLCVERFLLKRVEAVVCASEERRDIYIKERGCPPDRIWVVHDIISAQLVPKGSLIRGKLGLPVHFRKIMLYTGALQSGRCIPESIEAFSMIDEPDTCFIFVGRDTEPDFWSRHAQPVVDRFRLSDRIYCAGWFPPEQMPAVVSEGDVGIILYSSEFRGTYHCTSSRIGFYISQSVPVVVPPYPYISRLVRESGIGVVADDCSKHAIARAMELALHLPQNDLEAAFIKARQKHNWENEDKVLMNVLNSLFEGTIVTSQIKS
jgi:glycosyltransferase involved in cell wall biosynthesis